MAFESHVLENGRWVTRTTNINDLINNNNHNKAATRPAAQRQHAPQCGLMTRTLVHSSVAHWIVSVRLRSSQHNDVAFIGVMCPPSLSGVPPTTQHGLTSLL